LTRRFLIERGYVPGAELARCLATDQVQAFCDTMGQADALYKHQGYFLFFRLFLSFFRFFFYLFVCRMLICSSVIVMVVEANEKNTSDQRQLEYSLWKRYNMTCLLVLALASVLFLFLVSVSVSVSAFFFFFSRFMVFYYFCFVLFFCF
jgi:hypothetical protein